MSCILCQEGVESRDHLFFSCPFEGDVWSRVLRVMASSHRIGHWGVELSWICHQGIGKGVRRKLWCVLWCATIYFIWNERNHRLHGGQARDPIVLFHNICTWIRVRTGSWQEGFRACKKEDASVESNQDLGWGFSKRKSGSN
ncbi:hypothetical protein E6C27_scaffold581G00300 [Cucumis melo var. makuwa]|uniref:Reverse transcriptase zinc-binding domain-containing protein n=1 Tax=Cucumis melo var. makuwa TaxID=1194695 RepID=A0A5A7SK23_CUCMM|nr:hypothetical protein E6C27_scaffold581G00300 [Cucumis melo var. makuwa]